MTSNAKTLPCSIKYENSGTKIRCFDNARHSCFETLGALTSNLNIMSCDFVCPPTFGKSPCVVSLLTCIYNTRRDMLCICGWQLLSDILEDERRTKRKALSDREVCHCVRVFFGAGVLNARNRKSSCVALASCVSMGARVLNGHHNHHVRLAELLGNYKDNNLRMRCSAEVSSLLCRSSSVSRRARQVATKSSSRSSRGDALDTL